jgi:hypothetical protein
MTKPIASGIAFVLTILVSIGFAQDPQQAAKDGKKAPAQTISASSDQTGQHPGTAAIAGPARVTCASASSDIPNPQPRASCNITAPGFSGDVKVGSTIGASGAGTVTLTCNGQGNRLACTARIQ